MSVPSRVVVPQLDLEDNRNPHQKISIKGVKQITSQEFTADSASNNVANWSIQPPSQNTIIDRRFLLNVKVALTKSDGNNWTSVGTAGGAVPANARSGNCFRDRFLGKFTDSVAYTAQTATLLNNSEHQNVLDNNFALRQLPLTSCIDVLDLEINGTHMSVSIGDYIHAIMKYTTPEYREKYLSGSPSYPDYQASYGNLNNVRCDYGTDQYPLSTGNRNGLHGETTRGNFMPQNSTELGVPIGNELIFDLTEPLFISPLLVGGEFEGMTNVNQLNVSIRWKSDLSKIFSAVANASIPRADTLTTPVNEVALPADVSVDLKGGTTNYTPVLTLNFFTAQDDIEIPNEILLPYHQPQTYVKTISAVNKDALASVVGDNIRINQVPQKMYVWVQKSRASKNGFDADYCFAPESVNIHWNNQVGVLSGASKQVLHQISTDNGLDVGYNLAYQSGYAMCFEFGKDIPLETGESIGTHGNYNLRVDGTFRNNGNNVADVEYNILLVMNGSCIISPNECRLTLGNLNVDENMSAVDMGDRYKHIQNEGVFGGSAGGGFFSHLKHFVKRGLNVAHNVAGAVQKYAPMVQSATASASRALGGTAVGGTEVGGSRRRRK